MKLAEALAERAALQKCAENTKRRLLRNAAVREGDSPAEDPEVLLSDLDALYGKLTVLVQRINRTNTATRLDTGQSLMEVLAEREILGLRVKALQGLADAATEHQMSYAACGHMTSTINVADIQRQADKNARLYRLLDCRVQEANWNTTLAD